MRPTDFSTAFKRHGRHFARYLFAAKLATGKRVLDIACGGGFGSAYLAMHAQAQSVVGMDLDDKMLEHARATFHAGNLEFRKHDLHEPISDVGPFDLITTFETLEHVRDPLTCVRTITAALAEGQIYQKNASHYLRKLIFRPAHHAESYRFTQGLDDTAKTWLAICQQPVERKLIPKAIIGGG